jgi:putative transposase
VPQLPYGPPNVRLIRPKRLPQALRDAGVALVEQKLSNSTVKDLVSISDNEWQVACRRFNATQRLSQHRGRLQARVDSIAKMFGVTERTVRRWLSIYRKNPDIVALLPKSRGQKIGTRRLAPNIERLLNEVIDTWAAKASTYRSYGSVTSSNAARDPAKSPYRVGAQSTRVFEIGDSIALGGKDLSQRATPRMCSLRAPVRRSRLCKWITRWWTS